MNPVCFSLAMRLRPIHAANRPRRADHNAAIALAAASW